MESGNIVVTFGKNYIEIFNFSQINDNINNKIVNQLEKKFEISINNNNNFKIILLMIYYKNFNYYYIFFLYKLNTNIVITILIII